MIHSLVPGDLFFVVENDKCQVGRIRRSLVFEPRGLDLFVSGAMGFLGEKR